MGSKTPYLFAILIQTIYAGMFMLSKAAFNGGMNKLIFVFYRQAVATIFLTPLALFFEWKKSPPLSFVTFCKIFLLSLIGITLCLDLNSIAIDYTSASLAAATTNSLPVITFFLALVLRIIQSDCIINWIIALSIVLRERGFKHYQMMEVLKLRTTPGVAKLIGIIVCIGGVGILAFYKGPHFKLFWHLNILGHNKIHHHHSTSAKTWVKGCFIMLSSNTLWSLWLVLQAIIIKSYPSKLLFTALQCFLTSVQSFSIAIAFERDFNKWKLQWNVGLLAVAYCGFVVTGVSFYLQTCVIEKKGPVFLAMWTPLTLVITILVSAILLGEIITLGSLLGGLCLVGGLYCVLWAKTREQKLTAQESSSKAEAIPKECLESKKTMTSPSLIV